MKQGQFTQHGAYVYNKANCHNKERKDFTNKYGEHFSLIGIHAHEYTLIERRKSGMRITTFTKRQPAEAAYHLACKF